MPQPLRSGKASGLIRASLPSGGQGPSSPRYSGGRGKASQVDTASEHAGQGSEGGLRDVKAEAPCSPACRYAQVSVRVAPGCTCGRTGHLGLGCAGAPCRLLRTDTEHLAPEPEPRQTLFMGGVRPASSSGSEGTALVCCRLAPVGLWSASGAFPGDSAPFSPPEQPRAHTRLCRQSAPCPLSVQGSRPAVPPRGVVLPTHHLVPSPACPRRPQRICEVYSRNPASPLEEQIEGARRRVTQLQLKIQQEMGSGGVVSATAGPQGGAPCGEPQAELGGQPGQRRPESCRSLDRPVGR